MEPKELLQKAARSIANEIRDNGLSAHSATVKVARELDLNPNFIKRAAEVMNVALTYNHFKQADDRSANFEIVDAEKVAQEVFAPTVKTASTKDSLCTVVVKAGELPNFNQLEGNSAVYAASKKIASSHTPDNEMSILGLLEKGANCLQRYERTIDDLQYKQADATEKYAGAFFSLTDHFKKDANYRSSFANFETQALAHHGTKVAAFLECLHAASGCEEARGNVSTDSIGGIKLQPKCAELQAFESFLKYAEESNVLAAELGKIEKEAEEANTLIKSAYATFGEKYLGEFEPSTATVEVEKVAEEMVEKIADISEELDPVMREAKLRIQKQANEVTPEDEQRYLTPLQASSLPQTLKKKIIDSKKDKRTPVKIGKAADFLGGVGTMYKERTQPSSNIRTNSSGDNLQRKLMLQEMLATDPILSSKSPGHVADAYSQMLRIAPDLSNEPEIVRAVLRGMTEAQALDPHTGNQLIEANTNLVKQKGLLANGGNSNK